MGRGALFAVVLVTWCCAGVACQVTAVETDAGVDSGGGSGGDAAPDGDAACMLSFTSAGCDAAPVCLYGPQDACAGYFCGCDDKSFLGGCGFADKPFASWGLCDGDVGDAPAGE